MPYTSQASFNRFSDNIRLTDSQSDLVKSRNDVAYNLLKKSFGASSNMQLLRTSLIGSAQRDTIVRPLNDVDMVAVFDHTNVWPEYQVDSFKFLYRIRSSISDLTQVQAGARGQVVRLFYQQEPHVDIVPAFSRQGGGYLIPGGSGDWLSTDPDSQAEYMARRQRELSYCLKRFVRMLKHWNRAHSKRLQSFHLEVIASETFRTLGANDRGESRVFFGAAGSNIDVYDPAGHGGNLAQYLTPRRRNEVLRSFESALDLSERSIDAESRGDHATAIGLWRRVYGDYFPTYG